MKKILKLEVLALALLAIVSCKDFKKGFEDGKAAAEKEMEEAVEDVKKEAVTHIKFMMEPKSDSDVKGEVTFTEENGVVKMVASLNGLTEGEHAIHIHQTADCSSADGKSTGGHWNPTNEPHGKWGAEEGYHKGDIGNFKTNASGRATVTKTTDEWCIGCGDDTKDILGKAVIVHVGVDDLKSQPSGAAGARVGCAGIIE